jgi:hypothetical protein
MNSASEPKEQLLDERLAGLMTPAGNDDLRALLGEGNGSSAPDAGQSARDQYDWVAHFPLLTISCFLPAKHGIQRREADKGPRDVSRERLLSWPQIGTPGACTKKLSK